MMHAFKNFVAAWRQQAAVRAYHRSTRRTVKLDAKLARAVARESVAAERMENCFGAAQGSAT